MTFADNAARAVVLDIDRSGSEVAGCFDPVDALYAVRGTRIPAGASQRIRVFGSLCARVRM
jgi:hypothetical protein